MRKMSSVRVVGFIKNLKSQLIKALDDEATNEGIVHEDL